MNFKVALFDMDGVIVNTEPLHRKAYFRMFDYFDLDVSEKLYNSFAGKATLEICREIVNHFELDLNPQDLVDRKRENFKYLFDRDPEFDLIPGVLELIKNYYKNGIKMVLASSASMQSINWMFERFDLEKYFITKISGADLKASKPHPEIFELAAEKVGEARENCIVIEDATNGIKAAHAAGIYCVAYVSEHSKDQNYDLAQKVILDFKDIYVEKNFFHEYAHC
ncbi:MAG TPA: HAD family phosphatase [Chitinophagaceae bacterium]|nr:HAD family phosphatase [Chitinophagaceae bacterium]